MKFAATDLLIDLEVWSGTKVALLPSSNSSRRLFKGAFVDDTGTPRGNLRTCSSTQYFGGFSECFLQLTSEANTGAHLGQVRAEIWLRGRDWVLILDHDFLLPTPYQPFYPVYSFSFTLLSAFSLLCLKKPRLALAIFSDVIRMCYSVCFLLSIKHGARYVIVELSERLECVFSVSLWITSERSESPRIGMLRCSEKLRAKRSKSAEAFRFGLTLGGAKHTRVIYCIE